MHISVIASGSNGNCCLVETQNTSIVIDAGKSGKEIEKRMNRLGKSLENVDALLITHAHSDHISGAGVISRRHNVPIYISHPGYRESYFKLGKIQHKAFTVGDSFTIRDISIQSIDTAHSDDSCGFVFNNEFGYFTDTGIVTKEMRDVIPKLKGMLLESNHDIQMVENGPYPYYLKQRVLSDEGHLCNEVASSTIQESGEQLKLALLGHLSGINNTEELVQNTFESTVKREIDMHICSRHAESGTWRI